MLNSYPGEEDKDTRMLKGQQNSNRHMHRSIVPVGATVTQHDRQPSFERNQTISSLVGGLSHSSLSQSSKDSLLRQQALSEAQQGNRIRAIALLDIVINRNPASASDYNNRGLLHFQSGQFEQALTDYDKALQLSPRLAKVYNNRANCYASLGQLAEALADYETAIDLNPANLHAWLNQGITYRDLEMYAQAIENFDIALQFNQLFGSSSSRDAMHSLEGHIYAERGRAHHLAGDWNYAVADYQRAIVEFSHNHLSADPACRLLMQVETWLNDLLSPLSSAL